ARARGLRARGDARRERVAAGILVLLAGAGAEHEDELRLVLRVEEARVAERLAGADHRGLREGRDAAREARRQIDDAPRPAGALHADLRRCPRAGAQAVPVDLLLP